MTISLYGEDKPDSFYPPLNYRAHQNLLSWTRPEGWPCFCGRTGGQDSRVQVYDLRKKAKTHTLDKHMSAISSMAFSACGEYVRPICLAYSQPVRVWHAWESAYRSRESERARCDDYVFRFISDCRFCFRKRPDFDASNSSPVLS
jgi:hypothetical protein